MDENSTQPSPAPAPQPTQPSPAPAPQPTQPSPAPAPQPQPAPQPPVIESASATTSTDNHAGAAPYVIVVSALAVLVALSLALANIVSAAGEAIGDAFDEDYYDSFDYDDFLGDLDGDLDPQGSAGHDLTADNVFDEDLTCTDYTVDDYVFASDYSGSQQSVSTYVKSLAKTDADASGQVAGHLRAAAAATDDATRTDELAQAAAVCQDATTAIDALAQPDASAITGDATDDILEDLAEGRDATKQRWDKLTQLVAILASPEGHTSSELADLDNDAGNVTDPAIYLTRALSTSAAHK